MTIRAALPPLEGAYGWDIGVKDIVSSQYPEDMLLAAEEFNADSFHAGVRSAYNFHAFAVSTSKPFDSAALGADGWVEEYRGCHDVPADKEVGVHPNCVGFRAAARTIIQTVESQQGGEA